MFNKDQPDQPRSNPKKGAERRQYRRIERNYILTYFEASQPTKKVEITQLKNISLGGMCFITTKSFALNSRLIIELKTPYLTEATYFEGIVLESHEKLKSLIYETRLQFEKLNPQAEFTITKLMEVISNGKETT